MPTSRHPAFRRETSDDAHVAGADPRDAELAFLRGVLASSADCIKVLDLDANLLFMTETGQRVMEVSDFNAIKGCPWPDFWQDQGNVSAKAAVAAARAGGVGQFQGQASTLKGTPKWWDVQVTPILGPDGRPERLLSVSRDITAQKTAEHRQALLIEELAHRVKNTLAMVQAIASQTFRGEASFTQAREAFTSRLTALSRAHDLLLQGSWTAASLLTLVHATAGIHASESRFHIAGPDIRVGPQAALSFALAMHELGTNALKYGALSAPGGHVDVVWQVSQGTEPRFTFSWTESGGPRVTPPTRRGFGSRLIDRTLVSSLGASAVLAYPPEGMTLTLDAPLSHLQTS